DAEKVRQLCSRIVQILNVPQTVRLWSSLTTAALNGHFEHPASRSCNIMICKVTVNFEQKLSFPVAC
ncbi:MAG: hypothetical protein AAB177_14575, partial [Nitrospirota bacterium]